MAPGTVLWKAVNKTHTHTGRGANSVWRGRSRRITATQLRTLSHDESISDYYPNRTLDIIFSRRNISLSLSLSLSLLALFESTKSLTACLLLRARTSVQCWNLLGLFFFFPFLFQPRPNPTQQTVKLERDECLCAFLFPFVRILFIYFSA